MVHSGAQEEEMTRRYHNLFAPQSFSCDEEALVTRNNMCIDFCFGHHEILREFVIRNPDYEEHFCRLKTLPAAELRRESLEAASKSVLMTVVMLTGECNADCGICYTDRKKKADELSVLEIKGVLNASALLGSRLLYVPGEGEPTLDAGLFDILEHARGLGMEVILFTNGILLSNDRECYRRWQMTSEQFARCLSNYPVYIFHKLWSTDPTLVSEMMKIDRSAYQYVCVTVGKRLVSIPSGLARLLRLFPRDRVGIETVIEKRNIQEAKEVIIPLVQALGIKSYVEPLIHAGRCFADFCHDPDPKDFVGLEMWLARENCKRVVYKVVVQNDGTLSYGMAIPTSTFRQIHRISPVLNLRDSGSTRLGLFESIHSNEPIVWGRYQTNGCICERLNIELAISNSDHSGAPPNQANGTLRCGDDRPNCHFDADVSSLSGQEVCRANPTAAR